jgi:predicted aspartyl protease
MFKELTWRGWWVPVAAAGWLLAWLAGAAENVPDAAAGAPVDNATVDDPTVTVTETLQEIVIQAPEPRYVAPTRRDRIGRIWAPVYINDKGPFRLVLDTGANSSAVIAEVAATLGIPLNQQPPVRLRGVTGTATVPAIRVDTMVVGDLLFSPKRLPIVTDALGGAQGILGSEGMADKRIYIDFRRDLITITRSRNERAGMGFLTIPVRFERGRLLIVDAMVGNVRAKAIVDTGGQATIANKALRDALHRMRLRQPATIDNIVGATTDVQQGEGYPAPPIELGSLQIRSSHITFGDMHIFEHWKLTHEPAVLIGMDVLGLLETLVIDYRRRELHIKMRS